MTALEQGFVTFASALSATVVNALWQDALLVVCVWLLLRAWPKINAATRYVVWSATLAAAIIVPVATTLAFFTAAQPATKTQSTSVAAMRLSAPVPAVPAHTRSATPAASPAAVSKMPERLRVTLPAPVAIGIFGLWLILALYALTRLAIGLFRLEQLKRDALPLPVEYRDAMPQWLRANKGTRDVRLCVSDETDVPVAVGLFDAMILIPRSLLDRLSEPEVDQICLHELAHLRRADDWTNGLQRIINALLGWNPAALFIGQQLDLEREVACDDWVLSFVGTVRPYALCLTKMAESAAWPRNPIPAPGVFATRKHISLRIERLLGAGRNIATNLAPAPAGAAVAMVVAIAMVIALVAPSVAASCVTTITIPPIHVYVPPVHVNVPKTAVTVPKTVVEIEKKDVEVPAVHVNVPATHANAPATHVEVPATRVEVPAVHVNAPATHVEVPAVHVNVPGMHVDVPGMKLNIPTVDTKGLVENINRSVSSSVSRSVAVATGYGTAVAQAKSCTHCDFSGVNWAGRDLHGGNYSGADFSKANLERVNFSGSSFEGTDFSSANLEGASFRNARLSGCDFANANLSGADFSGAHIAHCDFTNLNLTNVNFSGARIDGADFTKATLNGANLSGATLTSCELTGVDLSHVNLSKTKITGSNFSEENSPP
ncbi:MAG: pentapeptide repeat-containing protein [Candidatus Eremiobacteraeota bacterium]|nr:pentapeptide repeat-containing protein [Candidatus Eremiobacteraeota bacterium]